MKQLIISAVLATLLVGCGEKPKFSINEGDTPETYANNPAFTKIKVFTTIDGKVQKNDDNAVFYKFKSAPVSTRGIETGDLNVLGGTVFIEKQTSVSLTIKGSEGFDKLAERLSKLKGFSCIKFQVEDIRSLACNNESQKMRTFISTSYNPFSDISTLNYTIFKH